MTLNHEKLLHMMPVGKSLVTDHEINQIEQSGCLHCQMSYSEKVNVTFVRLGNREVIWWHRNGLCPYPQAPVEPPQ